MKLFLASILLIGSCICQQAPGNDKQIRLDDIERDNLSNTQKHPQSSLPSQLSYSQAVAAQYTPQSQQLAAYQQQLYLQQLQASQQPQLFYTQQTVPPYNTIPIMIIPNHSPAAVPYLDQLTQYYLQQPQLVPTYNQYQPQRYQQHSAYQPQAVPTIYQQRPSTQYRPQTQINTLSKPATYQTSQVNSIQQSPLIYNTQVYNPYNAIYQQQQQKFAAGVKSTVAPPIKEQYSQQQSTNYQNYKAF